MISFAEAAPTTVGLKATYTEHVAAGARVAPHVSRASNEVGFVPVSVMDVKVTVAVPLLVSVNVFAAEVVPLF